MKTSNFPCTSLGAGSLLLFSGGYVLFGPMDFLGLPEPRWANLFFRPGIHVGMWAWNHVAQSEPLCYRAGVATMTLLGGAIGAVMDFLASPRNE